MRELNSRNNSNNWRFTTTTSQSSNSENRFGRAYFSTLFNRFRSLFFLLSFFLYSTSSLYSFTKFWVFFAFVLWMSFALVWDMVLYDVVFLFEFDLFSGFEVWTSLWFQFSLVAHEILKAHLLYRAGLTSKTFFSTSLFPIVKHFFDGILNSVNFVTTLVICVNLNRRWNFFEFWLIEIKDREKKSFEIILAIINLPTNWPCFDISRRFLTKRPFCSASFLSNEINVGSKKVPMKNYRADERGEFSICH